MFSVYFLFQQNRHLKSHKVKMKFYLHVRMHSVLRTRLPLEGGILWIRLRMEEISVHLMQIIQKSFKFNIYPVNIYF